MNEQIINESLTARKADLAFRKIKGIIGETIKGIKGKLEYW